MLLNKRVVFGLAAFVIIVLVLLNVFNVKSSTTQQQTATSTNVVATQPTSTYYVEKAPTLTTGTESASWAKQISDAVVYNRKLNIVLMGGAIIFLFALMSAKGFAAVREMKLDSDKRLEEKRKNLVEEMMKLEALISRSKDVSKDNYIKALEVVQGEYSKLNDKQVKMNKKFFS